MVQVVTDPSIPHFYTRGWECHHFSLTQLKRSTYNSGREIVGHILHHARHQTPAHHTRHQHHALATPGTPQTGRDRGESGGEWVAEGVREQGVLTCSRLSRCCARHPADCRLHSLLAVSSAGVGPLSRRRRAFGLSRQLALAVWLCALRFALTPRLFAIAQRKSRGC
jgi:hypothetical protein